MPGRADSRRPCFRVDTQYHFGRGGSATSGRSAAVRSPEQRDPGADSLGPPVAPRTGWVVWDRRCPPGHRVRPAAHGRTFGAPSSRSRTSISCSTTPGTAPGAGRGRRRRRHRPGRQRRSRLRVRPRRPGVALRDRRAGVRNLRRPPGRRDGPRRGRRPDARRGYRLRPGRARPPRRPPVRRRPGSRSSSSVTRTASSARRRGDRPREQRTREPGTTARADRLDAVSPRGHEGARPVTTRGARPAAGEPRRCRPRPTRTYGPPSRPAVCSRASSTAFARALKKCGPRTSDGHDRPPGWRSLAFGRAPELGDLGEELVPGEL